MSITDQAKLRSQSTANVITELSFQQQSRISQILNSQNLDDKTKFILLTSINNEKKFTKPQIKDFYFTETDQPKALKKSSQISLPKINESKTVPRKRYVPATELAQTDQQSDDKSINFDSDQQTEMFRNRQQMIKNNSNPYKQDYYNG